ncbi:MAG: hypothetical protein LAO08_05185 [Acidobacteriia bacterium]|nr:hypothetical protein [Terriglobia bacterium]
MSKLMFAVSLFLLVPVLRAQQADTKDAPPQAEVQPAPQASEEVPNPANSLPAAIRPGHPLDPADVDILTGKRDRETEASRRAAAPILGGGYIPYGDIYGMRGGRGAGFDVAFLPVTRIGNPFFFSLLTPGGFGRGFGRGGFRGGR